MKLQKIKIQQLWNSLSRKEQYQNGRPYYTGIQVCNNLYGKKKKKEWIHLYVRLIHFAVHLKLIQHFKSATLQ